MNAHKQPESVWEGIKSFLIAVGIALVFRSVAYEPFHIPSASMYDTLYEGDYIFVSKLSYGYSRYSFPFGFKFFEGRIFQSEPERGDVAVFRLPSEPKIDYIKRIIGLPGDRVQMINGRLYINDQPVEVTRMGDVVYEDRSGTRTAIAKFDETLPNGRVHTILDEDENGAVDTTEVFTVPARHYFAMGDNRDNSQDSRFEKMVGFVPEENLIGRAEVIALSFNGKVRLWEVWKWPFAFRPGRWFLDIR